MDLSELKQGLQGIQQDEPEAPWLSKENLMASYGNWFDNDAGLGELLLGQLRSKGVDTQAATEAMLRELLQGLVDDMNVLQQRLSGFTQSLNEQMQQTQAVADSVQSAISMSGASATAQEILPPAGEVSPTLDAPMLTDVPPTDVPPTDVPPTDVPPTDVPPTDVPPTDVPPTDVPPTATVSDKRMKYVLSDASKKKILDSYKARQAAKQDNNDMSMNNHILSAIMKE
jgi:hypothetical protein